MKKWLWLVWILLLLIPVGVNALMFVHVEGVTVAGETENWIGFWGSYAGGFVTAFISFLILYRTIEYYKEENEQRLKESHKERLRDDLSSRLAYLNTKKFTVYYERLLEGQDPLALCNMLEETRVRIVNDFSSFKILYSGVYDQFIAVYEALTWRLENQLSWLSDVLSQIPHEDSPSRRRLMEKAKERFDKLAKIQPEAEALWERATKLINQ